MPTSGPGVYRTSLTDVQLVGWLRPPPGVAPAVRRAGCPAVAGGRMKALTQDRYGTHLLVFGDIERPTPREGQVLVRVVAAGMDRGAWHFMAGKPYLMRLLRFGLRTPNVAAPGTNFSGVVQAFRPDVSRF